MSAVLEEKLNKARKKAIKNPIPSNVEAYNRARDELIEFIIEGKVSGERNSITT